MFEHDFLALFPEIFLINATIILLIYGVVFSTSQKYDYPPLVCNVGWLGLLSVLITILLVVVGSPLAVANLVYNNLIIDNFTYFCQIFLLLSTASTMVMCLDYFKRESLNAFESIVLILLSTCSMLFMISAYDLIAMYYMWAPDVYEGSPTIVTAFFSIAPKISILANMLRVFIYSFYDPTWQQLFFFCSIASMILGALAATAQNKVKRLLAYSSIGHVGYLLIGFSCGTIEGIQSLLIGIFIYVLMTVNVFAIVLALRQNRFKYIADLGALAKTNPILAITLSITMFSYAGIPPLAGFCSKFYLFFAALGCGAYLLALIGVVTSVISCFYYIRLVKIMYFDTPKTWILYKPMDREKSLLLAITVFFTTFFFLYPSPLFLVTHQMALGLCL
uniref:NADH dehydrogenase subunit 2 n=1 Tax=Treubia lacunosa TaxID=93845 RepID=G4Y9Q4_9MARC|nr:NADH dehydrogenase subunit 2 [Treubia lacunosa]AEH99700.1 NADH dehydrogenase subunit 2 [Treubia lacunosa]